MTKYKTLIEFFDDLDSDKKTQVEMIRKIILNLGFELEENIKWNAPNYNYEGIDRITFNLMNKEGKVKLIIHMGTLIKEDKKANPILKNAPEFIMWNSNIRGTITFEGVDDINQKEKELGPLLINWLKLKV